MEYLQYVDLFFKCENITELTTNASTTFLFTTTVCRMVNFYWNLTRKLCFSSIILIIIFDKTIDLFWRGFINIVKLLDAEVQDILKTGTNYAKHILLKNARYAQRLTCFFWICALITGNLMCINSLVQSIFFELADQKPAVSLFCFLIKIGMRWVENFCSGFSVQYKIRINYINAIIPYKVLMWPKNKIFHSSLFG